MKSSSLFALLFLVACDCGSASPRRSAATSTAAPEITGRGDVPEAIGGDPALPGVDRPSPEAERRLRRALADEGDDYEPRTEHLEDGEPRFVNRLILESSPYLLQHAHNPVNWFPWGPEAFDKARAEGKPIFLSIGYSTCHWCHVMERESFEDLEIAAYLNEHFVAIKVDREERPDIDEVYMRAVQMMTGGGGWPMTVLMTPDKEPFFGGTYFPPRDGVRGAQRGLLSLLTDVATRYRTDREALVADAARMSQRLRDSARYAPAAGVPGPEAIVSAVAWMARSYDPVRGGFGRAPKFPQPARLELLLRYHRRTGDPGALAIVEHTLEAMYRGGIYDHVGGGFHRYATDGAWLVPHFEKMLYDNAQLAAVYTAAFRATGKGLYREVARETLDYVLSEMTSPEGGFYSATDADSLAPSGHAEEGYFFTWTPAELEDALGPERARVIRAVHGVTDAGNFDGRNILHRARDDDAVAAELGITPRVLRETLASSRADLYRTREARPAPLRDDKILTAWNGLMISAFARAAVAFSEERYRQAALRASRFLLAQLRDEDGRLLRAYRDGRARHDAYLDDYAFSIAALLDAYEATGEAELLEGARALEALLNAHYLDAAGGYYATADDHEQLLVRDKPSRDGALPSGNAVAILNGLRLAELTGDDAHREVAERGLSAFADAMRRAGGAMPLTLAALDFDLDAPREVVIVSAEGQGASPLEEVLAETYLPNALALRLVQGAPTDASPLLEGKTTLDGRPTAYVCERGHCELPTTDPEVFRRQLAVVRPLTDPAPPPLSVPR